MYSAGDRVCLDYMQDDPCPVSPGTCGTVVYVDDLGTVHVKWDNGRGLGLIPGIDRFHKI